MAPEALRKAAADLPPDIRTLLANLWRGAVKPESLVAWATDQLVEGRDSPNLRILAGLSGDDSQEAEEYLGKALTDLGIPLPDKRECLVYYCGDVARDILKGAVRPLAAFNILWQINSELNYPLELRSCTQLEGDLDMLDDREVPVAQREEAVRQACTAFLAVLDGYTQTGVPRLTTDRSFEILRARGWDAPASADQIPRRMPVVNDNDKRLSFFRTRVDTEDFRDLTIPRTLFLRSEIVGCRFENTDLAESSMTWCDWTNCNFMKADLRKCDLRRSVFKDCYFYDAILDDTDLRGAKFIHCKFGHASMKGTKLEKTFGLFKTFRRRQLRLSQDQSKQIAWTTTLGAEPPGG
jgi:hypothetical protein